jgi:hypothetical protein
MLKRPRARENQEYSFSILPFPTHLAPHALFLFSSPPNWSYAPLFGLIRSTLTPTRSASLHSHLVFRSTFFTRLAPQTTRCAQTFK